MNHDTFNQWFMHEEIHEEIPNREDMLVQIIHYAVAGYDSPEMTHSRITTMLKEAYLLGKNDV
jgi:hypothetical protein